MNDLSKQQLILLALLVSFMTSLSTGIVTVSLMDQAPKGVTQTISQVIERTIQQASPQSAAVSVSVDDQIASAVASVSPSVVRIEDMVSGSYAGLGLVVSSSGVVMTDKSVASRFPSLVAVFSDGSSVGMSLIEAQADGDIAFLSPSTSTGTPSGSSSSLPTFTPVIPATSFRLGQMVLSLSGTTTPVLGQGLITSLAGSSSPIATSISFDKAPIGAPLFDAQGEVIGMKTASLPSDGGASFYPFAPLEPIIPVVR